MPHLLPAYSPVTVDTRLNAGPTLLSGLVVLASVTGGDVTIYDGLDADAGRLVGRFEGEADISNPIMFPEPIPLGRGLYVDIGSNITQVLVLWRPMSDEEARTLG